MIYTSYYAKLWQIPDSIVPISISRTVPDGLKIASLIGYAPSEDLLWWWKKSNQTKEDIEHYTEEYNKQLSRFNAQECANLLHRMYDNKDIVLLCWEAPDKFCHRHLLRKWFNKNGVECIEY